MGIGTPLFFQSYDELQRQPPDQSSYESVLLDEENGWIEHHSVGVDGPIMHLDERDLGVLQVYLLSYERHRLTAHLIVEVAQ